MLLTHPLLKPICALPVRIQTAVILAREQTSLENLATVAEDADGDTLYTVDRMSKAVLIDFFQREGKTSK